MYWRKACVFAALAVAVGGGFLMAAASAMAAWPTEELPAEDVRNTKHNFFLNQDVGYTEAQTTEICVFCHTPHGGRPSDATTAVPLWNRALPSGNGFTMYDSPNFDGKASQTTGKPLGVSLACLSCHDGTIGIDSLINSPGSGGFQGANKTGDETNDVSLEFHNGVRTLGVDTDGSMAEGLRPDCTPGVGGNCFATSGILGPQTNAQFFVGYPDFSAPYGMEPFPNLGQNLSDDHPISMQIPNGEQGTSVDPQFSEIASHFVNSKPADGTGVTWISRTGVLNQDSRDRLRAYPSGGANTEFVECASCHNPHTPRPLFLQLPNAVNTTGGGLALPTGGGTTPWSDATGNGADTSYVSNNPNFQSAICLSCHQK
jgi:hypothetical protein